jgi:hypothetical protein
MAPRVSACVRMLHTGALGARPPFTAHASARRLTGRATRRRAKLLLLPARNVRRPGRSRAACGRSGCEASVCLLAAAAREAKRSLFAAACNMHRACVRAQQWTVGQHQPALVRLNGPLQRRSAGHALAGGCFPLLAGRESVAAVNSLPPQQHPCAPVVNAHGGLPRPWAPPPPPVCSQLTQFQGHSAARPAARTCTAHALEVVAGVHTAKALTQVFRGTCTFCVLCSCTSLPRARWAAAQKCW